MSRVYNFSAGPSMLPEPVLKKAADEMLDYQGCGQSVMEMSHRSKQFDGIIKDCEALLREVMNIPDNYKVLFLQGGCSSQFAMVPMNLMNKNHKADYVITGQWAKKAAKEAARYGEVNIVASSEDKTFTYIPKLDKSTFSKDADYFYICMNNTIYGTVYHELPDTGDIPLVADISSCIMSEPIDVSKFGCLIAGAQKNLSMAGVTVIVVKDEMLGKAPREIPTMLDYRTHVEKGSMFNTPPVVPIYTLMENLRWLKANGGVEAADKRAHERAEVLYTEIDRNKLFKGTVDEASRSLMNICFVMNDEYKELEKPFLDFATQRGMVGIKGHRSVGGFRASCYNAQTMEGVQALVKAMQDFEAQH